MIDPKSLEYDGWDDENWDAETRSSTKPYFDRPNRLNVLLPPGYLEEIFGFHYKAVEDTAPWLHPDNPLLRQTVVALIQRGMWSLEHGEGDVLDLVDLISENSVADLLKVISTIKKGKLNDSF